MDSFVPWNSQALDVWSARHAEGNFIDLASRHTHFIERGQGKPVILIHGFNLDLHTWIKNLDRLASRFRVYAPDLWGQGYSTRKPLPEFGCITTRYSGPRDRPQLMGCAARQFGHNL